MRNRVIVLRARRQHARPFHEVRHMDAAFKEGRLPTAIGLVDIRQADVMRAAIVTGEDDERIVVKPLVLQRLQDVADITIKRTDHRRIDAQAVVLDHRQGIIVFLLCLQRRMRRIESQVDEERTILVRLDRGDSLIAEIVGHIFVRRKRRPAILADAERQNRPEEPVDRIPGLTRFFHRR